MGGGFTIRVLLLLVAEVAAQLYLPFLEPSLAQASASKQGGILKHGERRLFIEKPQFQFGTTKAYNEAMLAKVDRLVHSDFYDEKAANTSWPLAVARHRRKIVRSGNLKELGENINLALDELAASHTQFLTANDEMYFFLGSMFAHISPKFREVKMDYTGAITGGAGCDFNQVRYVLDGSPAFIAGIQAGDRLVRIDKMPYRGQSSFWGKAGKMASIDFKRGEHMLTVSLKPVAADVYDRYVAAIKDSARIISESGAKLGYVHLWCGGEKATDALAEVILKKLSATDGLIIDFRDGYGGNSLEDLDPLYRTRRSHPQFEMTFRGGKSLLFNLSYENPCVVIINRGVRSGRELLAASLKRTGRAVLVGEPTAGAVLGGRLFPIDDRSALYLAVSDCQLDGERMEGKGVAPDIAVSGSPCDPQAKDTQLKVAKEELIRRIMQQR